MWYVTRFVVLSILILAGIAYPLSSAGQTNQAKPKVSVRTRVDGKFLRYLESPSGDIDGVLLSRGTVARFPAFRRTSKTVLFRPGDSVRVEGDRVSGLNGPYLVRASVTRTDAPITRGAISPSPPTGPGAKGSRARRADVSMESPKPREKKKGLLENLAAKANAATTGKGRNGNDSKWSRSEETAGP